MRLRHTHKDGPDPVSTMPETDPEVDAAQVFGASRRQRLSRLRNIGPTGVWPTLFTLGNLVAGFAAIHFAAKPGGIISGGAVESAVYGPWGWTSLTVASALVLLGVFLDSVDGSVARLTDSITEMGGQLDSLADLITFGVAPAFITLNLLSQYIGPNGTMEIISPDTGHTLGKLCWAIAAIYVCCAALRLARFNVETASGRLGDHLTFRGLPTPGAAGAVIGLVLMHEHVEAIRAGTEGGLLPVLQGMIGVALPLVTLLAAVMMVSSISYQHMANRYLRVKRSFGYLVRVAAILCLAIWWLQETLAVVFLIYLLSGPWSYLSTRVRAYPAGGRA